MKRASFLRRLSGGRAAAGEAEQERAGGSDLQGYVPVEDRAQMIFRELYPGSHPADYPRAVYVIMKGLREAEAGAVMFSDRTMFLRGVDAATQEILALVTDPATCIDQVTGQPTASHFDWRNITRHIVDRIHLLKIEPPTT